MKEICLLVPVFNEENNIPELLDELEKAILSVDDYSWKLLFIDDGSNDRTWDVIQRLKSKTLKIGAIRLTRNFGKELALMAGVDQCESDAAITMDSDMQHPPKLIPKLVRKWESGGYSIVEGIKSNRGKESAHYSILSRLYYLSLGKLSGLNIKESSDFKLIDHKVLQLLKSMPERNVFFRGLTAWSGFPSTQVPFKVEPRKSGRRKMTTAYRFNLALNSIFSFSKTPLTWILKLSLLFIVSAFFLAMNSLYQKLTHQAMPGFTTVIILQLFIGGSILFALGIIGSYLARIYDEVKARPRYAILDKLTD